MVTRYKAVKEFTKKLSPDDVVIFFGDRLCEEAYVNDRSGNFYYKAPSCDLAALALGIAMTSIKRVFVVTTDNVFLRFISTAFQMAVSQCKNIYYVLLVSGSYISAGGHPNVFYSSSHPQGLLFRMGFTSFIFDSYFKSSEKLEEMSNIISTMVGPASIIINVLPRKSTYKKIDKPNSFFINRLKKFLLDDKTAMFNPPPLDTFNLDTVKEKEINAI